MRTAFYILLAIGCNCFNSCKGQTAFGTNYLQLVKTIPLPHTKGRMDHMAINLKDQTVYVAALGNNSLEVIDLIKGKQTHSITGLKEPQGVEYIPQQQEIIVANGGTGDCFFFNAQTFEKTFMLHLSSHADDVRYDSVEQKIYVGYGNGGIAVIDAPAHKLIGNISLPAHPEGFQLDQNLHQLWVNLPDAQMIGIVDIQQNKLVRKLSNNYLQTNFPMAIDTAQHLLFIAYRRPPKLVVINAKNEKQMGTANIVGDADDVYYNNHKVYVSGGSGAINILQQEGNNWKQIANIPTHNGARTSLLIPALQLFVVVQKAAANKAAALLVYKINP